MSELVSRLQSGAFNEWEIIWKGMPVGWIAVLTFAAIVAIMVWGVVGVSRLKSKSVRAAILVLRAIAVFAILVLLFQPAIELKRVVWRKTHLVVLIDDSQSMSLPAQDTKTRVQAVAEWLKAHTQQLKELSRRYYIDFYKFSNRVQRTQPESLKTLSAEGARTAIYGALLDIATRYRQEDLSGILLLTDGCDNVGMPEGFAPKPGECAVPSGCETPIFAVYPDFDEDELADLGIVALHYDDFAFVHNTITVDVEVLLTGFGSRTVPVSLLRDGRIVSSVQVRLNSGEPKRVSLSFKPRQVGRALYEVKVPILKDERITSNNSRTFLLKVIRDKVRVLQVVGRPDWDERFLRRYLKKNPNVDLISFFILRTADDSFWVPENELSLIPFPTDELFDKQLHTFDLVIFQNFTYRGYQMSHYLDNIAEFVRNGGAFLMIGGDLAFAPGGYAHTDIETILPVKIFTSGRGYDEEPFRPMLTPEGERHPIMQLDPDRERNLQIWAQLPELIGGNTGLVPYDDTLVLAVHPRLTSAGSPAPVIAIRRVGEGRSMIVAADTTWLWNFQMVKRGETPRYYNQFWANAIRWLIKDPDLELLQIVPARDVYRPGERITLSVRALNEDFLPAANKQILVQWRSQNGESGVVEVKTDEEGLATVTFDAPRASGALTISARMELDSGRTEETKELVLIDAGGKELERLVPDVAFLRSLAKRTGGKVFSSAESVDLTDLDWVEARAKRVADREEVPLWDNWLVVVVAGLAFSLEWWLRKRNRLP